MTTADLWGLVSNNASPARLYSSQDELITCQAGSQQLTQGWPNVIDEASRYYSGRIFTKEETTAKATFLSFLPNSVQYLTGFSQSSSDTMQQILMANVFYDTLSAPKYDAPMNAGMQSLALAHMKLLQYANGWTLGEWGAESLVLLKNVLEALLYGGFLIIAWFLLLPHGIAVLKNYLVTLLWLQSFAPLYAVLNLLLTFHAQELSSSAFQNIAFSPLSLQGFPLFASTNADMVTVASWLSFSIPALAYGLVRGGIGAMSQSIGQLGYLVQSLTMRTAEEATSGNLNFGNTQMDTHTAHMDNAYQTNRNITLQSGMMTYQQPDGAIIHRTPDGSSVIESRNALSNTASNMNLTNAIRQVSIEQADHAITTGMQHSKNYSEATTASLRELYEAGQAQAFTHSRDNQHHLSKGAQWNENAAQTHQHVTRFAHDYNLTESQAVSLLGEVSASLGIAGFIGHVRGGAQIQGLSSAQHAELFTKAKDYVQSTHLNETIDTSLRVAHDQHQRQGSEQSSRLTQQLSSNYETATAARNEAIANFQTADSLRDLSSFSHETGLGLSANLNQKFVAWLSEQPNSQGVPFGITGAEQLLNHHPEKMVPYVEQFVEQRFPEIKNSLTTMPTSENTIKDRYQDNQQQMFNSTGVVSEKEKNNDQLQEESLIIKKNSFEFGDIQLSVDSIYDNTQSSIKQIKENQESLGEMQKKDVVQVTDPNQHDLTGRTLRNAGSSIESVWKKE